MYSCLIPVKQCRNIDFADCYVYFQQSCVDSCSGKFIVSNQKIMSTFVEIQSVKQQQMLTDAANQQQQQVAEAGTQLLQTSDTPDASKNSWT